MDKFFKNIESIDAYTRCLDCHIDSLECAHCRQNDQFVSHGFIYKQRSRVLNEPIGKRIRCSNRYGRTGCGRTFQLYIADQIPALQYGTSAFFIFITSLLDQFSVKQAYQLATGQHTPRNAWRWLNKLMSQIIVFRGFIQYQTTSISNTHKNRVKRLQILLPTLAKLMIKLNHCPCHHYQRIYQQPFVMCC